MSTLFIVAAAAFFCGCAAACGIIVSTLLCARIEAFEDGPVPRSLHPAIPIATVSVLGALIALRGATPAQLGIVALIALPLAGIWYADSRKGIVPDAFTLVPLGVIAVVVVLRHSWFVGISALVVFVVFAAGAALSKGRGMGWGDAKLAALVGAVLGLQGSLLTLALACFAATIVSVVRDRGTRPIAFGPYIVVATLLAIVTTIHG